MLDLRPDHRIVLNPCRWETYESILEQQADRSAPRFTYSEGMLEIMSPSPEHEELSRALEAIVQAACEQFQIPFRPLGSTTQRRPDLQKGAEPDSSFLLVNLRRDPQDHPPDLVIEVEISRSALEKLPIFAQLGIGEVWRCTLTGVQIFQLAEGAYSRTDQSNFLPLSAEFINQMISLKKDHEWLSWLRTLRQQLATL